MSWPFIHNHQNTNYAPIIKSIWQHTQKRVQAQEIPPWPKGPGNNSAPWRWHSLQNSAIICIVKDTRIIFCRNCCWWNFETMTLKVEIETKAKNFVLNIHIHVIQNCQTYNNWQKENPLNCKQDYINTKLFFTPNG